MLDGERETMSERGGERKAKMVRRALRFSYRAWLLAGARVWGRDSIGDFWGFPAWDLGFPFPGRYVRVAVWRSWLLGSRLILEVHIGRLFSDS